MIKNNFQYQTISSIDFSSYKHIFVDFDDTIIHTSYANFLAYKKAVYDVLGTDIIYINERFTHSTLLQLENNETKLNNIMKLKNQYYKEYLPYTFINNHLFNILNQADDNNIILVTNGKKERVELTLKHHHLQQLFTYRYYLDDNTKYTNKYINALNKIALQNTTVKLEDICIFENDDMEILHAITNGFKPNNIFKIQTKIYEVQI